MNFIRPIQNQRPTNTMLLLNLFDISEVDQLILQSLALNGFDPELVARELNLEAQEVNQRLSRVMEHMRSRLVLNGSNT